MFVSYSTGDYPSNSHRHANSFLLPMVSRAQVDKRVLHDPSSFHILSAKPYVCKITLTTTTTYSRRDESRLQNFPFLLLYSDRKFHAIITCQNSFLLLWNKFVMSTYLRHGNTKEEMQEEQIHLFFSFTVLVSGGPNNLPLLKSFHQFLFQSSCSKKSLAIPKWPRTKTFFIDRDNVLAWLPLI